MAKKATRLCDFCGCEVEDNDRRTDLSLKGWTEVKFSFGATCYAQNAQVIIRDACPDCAKEMGMIQINEKGTATRPKMSAKELEELSDKLTDHLKQFIIDVGNDEGWYE